MSTPLHTCIADGEPSTNKTLDQNCPLSPSVTGRIYYEKLLEVLLDGTFSRLRFCRSNFLSLQVKPTWDEKEAMVSAWWKNFSLHKRIIITERDSQELNMLLSERNKYGLSRLQVWEVKPPRRYQNFSSRWMTRGEYSVTTSARRNFTTLPERRSVR